MYLKVDREDFNRWDSEKIRFCDETYKLFWRTTYD